jgi:hypothetical protein
MTTKKKTTQSRLSKENVKKFTIGELDKLKDMKFAAVEVAFSRYRAAKYIARHCGNNSVAHTDNFNHFKWELMTAKSEYCDAYDKWLAMFNGY